MTSGIKKRKQYPEEEDQIEPTFDAVSPLPSASGAANVGLPEPAAGHDEVEPALSKEMRSAIDLPGVMIVNAAKIEHDQIVSTAKIAADHVREDARKNAAKKREETLAGEVAAAAKRRAEIIEKAKKEAIAFKSKKVASVPKVADAVFSKVFGDMF